jgi:DNA ligase-1
VEDGAEGLVLHRVDALWIAGRSDALLKLKLVPDEDARVISYIPGMGRHLGRMGALLLEMPSGQRFALDSGFNDAQRDAPPPIGAYVSYRYRDRTPAGLPRFASFCGCAKPNRLHWIAEPVSPCRWVWRFEMTTAFVFQYIFYKPLPGITAELSHFAF